MIIHRNIAIGLGAILLTGLTVYLWPKSAISLVSAKPKENVASSEVPSRPATPPPTPNGRPTPVHPELAKPGVPERNEPDINAIAKFRSFFKTPISFYGKVVDEKGNPIEGANVKLSAHDQSDPSVQSSHYACTTDKDGLFSITGIHGAGLYVEVSKGGYYKIDPSDGHIGSSGGFRYAGPPSNSDVPIPTPESPAVFILRKMGEVEPLIKVPERPVMLPKSGAPVDIRLKTGQAVPIGQGDIRVACLVDDQKKDVQGHYPWSCIVSVPGGGLVKREGEYNFTAPAEGYQPSDSIVPPEERWSPTAERQYFVKTANNQYARVEVRVQTGGERFMVVESYLNPQAGSRNLEYDPAKQK